MVKVQGDISLYLSPQTSKTYNILENLMATSHLLKTEVTPIDVWCSKSVYIPTIFIHQKPFTGGLTFDCTLGVCG